MTSINKAIFATACATAMVASSAWADTYICKHGNQERVISVVYEIQGQPVPCKVVYTKDTGVETPWVADNLAGYCEEKAAALVEKQRGWGWTCDKQEAAQEEAPAAEQSTMQEEAPAAKQNTMQEEAPAAKQNTMQEEATAAEQSTMQEQAPAAE